MLTFIQGLLTASVATKYLKTISRSLQIHPNLYFMSLEGQVLLGTCSTGGGPKLNSAVVLTYDTGLSDTIYKESRGC